VPDPRHERFAQVLVDYSTSVGEGDLVLIESTPLARPLVTALYRRVVQAGGHPEVRIGVDGAVEALLAGGNDEQLGWISPRLRGDAKEANVRIAIEAESNTRGLTGIDPARQATFARSRAHLRDMTMERAAAGELRRVVTAFPTNASAQDAEMSLADYEDFVYRAGFLDEEDPVASWQALGEKLARLAEWLGTKKELRVVTEGTDLTVGVDGRA
jgi:aminopeptidase